MAPAGDRSDDRAVPTGYVLALAGAGVFLAALDQTSVVTALPEIIGDIELPVTDLDQGAWIITGYLVGYTAAMPLVARLSDIYGHSRVYLASMAVFLLGSALVAVSDSLGWLIGARIVQAIGGGAVVPVAIALVGERLPASRRGVVIGVVVATAEAGAVMGPLYGGLIIHWLDWRWVFWSNLPIGGVIMLLMFLSVKSVRRPGLAVDYAGGVLLGVSLACLALGLSGGAVLPSGVGWQAGFLVAAGAALLAFFWWEDRAGDPLLPLSLLRKVPLAAANVANLLIGGGLILALVNIPLMTDTIMGKAPLEGGLRLLRLTMMIPVGAVIGGLLYQRFGYRVPMFAGLSLAALGFVLLSRWPLDVSDPRMSFDLMVGGLGFGLVVTPVTVAALNHVGEHQLATSSAMVTVMRMVGMIAGLSALSSWGQDRFRTLVARIPVPDQLAGEADAAAYEAQVRNAGLTFFHEVFIAAAIVCGVALLAAYLMGRKGAEAEAPG
ncbi:MAG: MFS transporter [Dehalococcoidia bacterium]